MACPLSTDGGAARFPGPECLRECTLRVVGRHDANNDAVTLHVANPPRGSGGAISELRLSAEVEELAHATELFIAAVYDLAGTLLR